MAQPAVDFHFWLADRQELILLATRNQNVNVVVSAQVVGCGWSAEHCLACAGSGVRTQ